MDDIMRIAKKHNIYVVEDNAQALGADYYLGDGEKVKAGTIGDIGTTSFFPSKNLGCYGDGGALFTNNDDLANEIRSITNHGMKVRYHHDRIGVNSRLDTIQAAILNVKLKYLEQYNAARISAANYYDSKLKSCSHLAVPNRVKWSNHIFHQYTLRVIDANRDELIKYLASFGIPSMVYYPVPLHKQKAFEPYKSVNANSSFPVSDSLAGSVISLPMHTEMDESTLNFICDKVLPFFK
jgi:dTDP-4-amino-4,6-dideoxygalactose transaminase